MEQPRATLLSNIAGKTLLSDIAGKIRDLSLNPLQVDYLPQELNALLSEVTLGLYEVHTGGLNGRTGSAAFDVVAKVLTPDKLDSLRDASLETLASQTFATMQQFHEHVVIPLRDAVSPGLSQMDHKLSLVICDTGVDVEYAEPTRGWIPEEEIYDRSNAFVNKHRGSQPGENETAYPDHSIYAKLGKNVLTFSDPQDSSGERNWVFEYRVKSQSSLIRKILTRMIKSFHDPDKLQAVYDVVGVRGILPFSDFKAVSEYFRSPDRSSFLDGDFDVIGINDAFDVAAYERRHEQLDVILRNAEAHANHFYEYLNLEYEHRRVSKAASDVPTSIDVPWLAFDLAEGYLQTSLPDDRTDVTAFRRVMKFAGKFGVEADERRLIECQFMDPLAISHEKLAWFKHEHYDFDRTAELDFFIDRLQMQDAFAYLDAALHYEYAPSSQQPIYRTLMENLLMKNGYM